LRAFLSCFVVWTVVGHARAEANGGGGLRFINASAQYVSMPTPPDLPIGNSQYTIEAWIRPTSMGIFGIVGWGNYGTVNQVNALRIDTNGIINYWWSTDLMVSGINLADGSYHHVAATYDGTTRRLLVDGVQVGFDVPSGHNVPSAANFAIGVTNNTEYFNGEIGEIRIWNVGRSVATIAAEMNDTLTGAEANLVALYRMEEGTGTTTADEAGTIVNGTLVNAPTWYSGAVLALSTTSLSFPDTATGESSPAQSVTISNTGTGNMAVSGIALSGTDEAMFSLSAGTCPSLTPTIAAAGSCAVDVWFNPSGGTSATRSAQLDVVSRGRNRGGLLVGRRARGGARCTGFGGVSTHDTFEHVRGRGSDDRERRWHLPHGLCRQHDGAGREPVLRDRG
jgi:hypothetical protein